MSFSLNNLIFKCLKKLILWENEVIIGILFLLKYFFYYKVLFNVILELVNFYYLYMNYKL